MFNSQTLEIAIGLVFVFLVASLLASAARELLESILKTRAVQLERGIRLLLDDPDGTRTTKELFDHPQLFSLFEGVYNPAQLTGFWRRTKVAVERRGSITYERAKRIRLGSTLPSYVPSRNFALALLDLAGAGGGDERSTSGTVMEDLHASAMTLRPGRLRDALLVALSEAEGDFDRARTSLEAWFDSCMDRVSGWYKRETQVILLVIGLLIAIAFNVDALSVANRLAQSNTLRQQILLQAEETRHKLALPAAGTSGNDADAIKDAEAGLGDLVGWSNPRTDHRFLMPLGWLITALAVSLGAPFWFDMLNKLMIIRSTVKPYEKSPSEGSDDRAGAPPAAERLEPNTSGALGAPRAELPAATHAEGPINGFVRLSVEVAQLENLVLSVDSQQQALPADGNVELPLEMGTEHQLSVTATDTSGKPVEWSQTVRVTYDDDLLPVTAELA